MKAITHYSYKGQKIDFILDDQSQFWFLTNQASLGMGYFNEQAINFDINMAHRKHLKGHIKITPIQFGQATSRTNHVISFEGLKIIAEGSIYQESKDFVTWLEETIRESRTIHKAIIAG